MLRLTKNKSIVDYTSPALLHSRHPFPPIGDAAYHQHARRGSSHRYRQHAHKKMVKIAHVVPEISLRTDRQTHRHTLITYSPLRTFA